MVVGHCCGRHHNARKTPYGLCQRLGYVCSRILAKETVELTAGTDGNEWNTRIEPVTALNVLTNPPGSWCLDMVVLTDHLELVQPG